MSRPTATALEQYGAALRAARRAEGFPLGQLADALGVHRRTLERWEAGRTVPSRLTRARLADLLRNPGLTDLPTERKP